MLSALITGFKFCTQSVLIKRVAYSTMPITAKPTGELLRKLRECFTNPKLVPETLHAYIIPSTDAHGSEYLAEADKRRAFISGFTGSAGKAIVTNSDACLWTDGRYFIQAAEQLDSNWTLMKEDLPDTPTDANWLSKTLPPNSAVGVDPQLMGYNLWNKLKEHLEGAGHRLVPVDTNLVDVIWENKPAIPKNLVYSLPIKYTGKTIDEKLEAVREKMQEKNASLVVMTLLDEIAWLLNLRGSDIDYNPVFFSYVIVTNEKLLIFIDPDKTSQDMVDHLNAQVAGSKWEILEYSKIHKVLKEQVAITPEKTWIDDEANYSLVSLVPSQSSVLDFTPVQLLKAVKNATEIQGMKNAHIKDAAALCSYLCWLEKNVASGQITEISGSEKLESLRAMQEDFMGPSFATISSVGPHGAIIHYFPSKESDVPLRSDCLYLCDSGGQYKDGTTDVTRTVHFGTPTDYEKECFTRVLKGQISFGSKIFPNKLRGNYLDSFARQFLWEIGLDYKHGTGHGVGAFLNVHEGPVKISWRESNKDPGLEPGMFISNEPGYYEDGKFGIRIEDVVLVVEANIEQKNTKFLALETVTLVPIQRKMINVAMLTDREIHYLNRYHEKCREVVGALLDKQGQVDVKEWLYKETQPLIK